MGNDNEDRRNPRFPRQVTLTSLEDRCNELWGPSNFDWTIGSSVGENDTKLWFYMAGTELDNRGKPRWKIIGDAPTITDALLALIESHE
jgi:hypothetical protein